MSTSTRIDVCTEPERLSLRKSVRFCLPFCLLLGGLLLPVGAQAPDQGVCEDPWTVCLFEHPDYLGARLAYSIEPGMRQRAVAVLPPKFEDSISSMKVGANVSVWIFEHRSFGGGRPFQKIYTESVQALERDEMNDKTSSIVIFPRAAGSALGLWGWNQGRSGSSDFRLFPVPDSQDETEARYPELGSYNLDKNLNAIGTRHAEVSVVLYEGSNFGGASLMVPSADSSWDLFTEVAPLQGFTPKPEEGVIKFVNVGQYGWSDRAASLIVRWAGPSPGRAKESQFRIFVNLDYPGRDYKKFPSPNGPAQCEQACLAEPKCQSFSWVKASQTCWLKTGVPSQVSDACCISGQRMTAPVPATAPPSKSMKVEYGTNLPGGDYKNFSLKGGPEDCQKACESDPKCQAFTWVKPGVQGPDAVCWLKNRITAGVTDKSTVSGFVEGGVTEMTAMQPMKKPPVATLAKGPTFKVEQGIDRPGGDYRHFDLSGGYEECRKACENDPRCKSFTWVSPNTQGRTAACWLKDSVPAAVKNAATVSGVLQSSSEP